METKPGSLNTYARIGCESALTAVLGEKAQATGAWSLSRLSCDHLGQQVTVHFADIMVSMYT